MAGLTIVANARVREVNCRREWCRGRVANDTVLGCRNMNCRFTDGDIRVVAGHAIVEDTSVTKNCPAKSRCIEVTVRTILIGGIGRYVVSRLARDDYVVVTIRAVIGDSGMIIGTSGKSAR